MGLMRALQGVGTGWLEARVGQFETAAKAKADKEALKDKYKAEETMRINVKNNELTKNAETKAIKDAEDRERRKQELLSRGFTEDYLMLKGQYALSSDSNLTSFLQEGADHYGVTRWWITPANFGNKDQIGKTVQEIELSNVNKKLNSDTVKKVTEETNNISSSVSENQLDTGTASSASGAPLSGKALFVASPKRAQSEGELYINTKTGEESHLFQYEQDIGDKNWGDAFYKTTYEEIDGILMPQLSMVTNMGNLKKWDINTAKQFKPFIDKTSQTSYLIRNPKTGLQERVTGQMTTYTNGTTPTEVLYGISPSLIDGFGIDLQEVLMTPIEGTPFFTEETINKDFLVDKTKFNRAVFDVHGYELQSVSSTNSPSSTTSAYKELGNSRTNTIKANAVSIAGFNSSDASGKKDFFNETIEGEGLITRFYGDTEAQKSVPIFLGILDDSLSYLKNKKIKSIDTGGMFGNLDESQGRFSFPPNIDASEIDNFQQNYAINKNNTISSELGLDMNSGTVDEANFVNRVAEYFKTIRQDLAQNEILKITNLSTKTFKDSEGNKTSERQQYAEANGVEEDIDEVNVMASRITDNNIQRDITTLDELLEVGAAMKERRTVATTNRKSKADREERESVSNYFPQMGDIKTEDSFESFIDNYVNDPNSDEQVDDLIYAINNLTSEQDERDSLFRQARKYLEGDKTEEYPYDKQSTDFKTRENERDVLKQIKDKKETGFTSSEWINSNKVAELPSEMDMGETFDDSAGATSVNIRASNWRKKYPDYDIETGLKKFVSENLPTGHVESRPTKGFFKGLPNKSQEDWDRIWSDTHGKNGVPLTENELKIIKDKKISKEEKANEPRTGVDRTVGDFLSGINEKLKESQYKISDKPLYKGIFGGLSKKDYDSMTAEEVIEAYK